MNVILLENIKSLGVLGDNIIVRAGFARNYLLPKGKAVRASKENIAYFNSKKAEFEQKAQENFQAAKDRAAQLEQLHITVGALAADEGKLYGSVGVQEIVKAIKDKGIETHRNEVKLPEGPFRALGDYKVPIHLLHGEVITSVNLSIIADTQ